MTTEQYRHAAPVTISGVTVQVQCWRDEDGSGPVPLEEWPLSPEELADVARDMYVAAGGRTVMEDVQWAVETGTLSAVDSHYWRLAMTDAQLAALRASAVPVPSAGDGA